MNDEKDPKRFGPVGGDDFGNTIRTAVYDSVPSGCASYGKLAQNNYDHFVAQPGVPFEQQGGAGSVEAYTAGHHEACTYADRTKDQGEEGLKKALIMNACASHFLSDAFAPGHQTSALTGLEPAPLALQLLASGSRR